MPTGNLKIGMLPSDGAAYVDAMDPPEPLDPCPHRAVRDKAGTRMATLVVGRKKGAARWRPLRHSQEKGDQAVAVAASSSSSSASTAA